MKSHAEFSPWRLVAVLNGGGEVSLPSTHESTKLLGHKQGLLELRAVQKPKLGVNDAKPVIRLQQINCLSKHTEGASPGSWCRKSPPLAGGGVGAPHAARGSLSAPSLAHFVWPIAARGSQTAEVAVVVGEFYEQHCEAHSLLPRHERSTTQAHPK
jgi:hypothetical protein